uniref:DUF4219 domain-containing protein n=1 Tax=Cajanus cajan TaxID=3821 RepID=A0A151SP73_CAJCA|nr:hypothetical protein KK1_002884 [Cajanus cajan]
MANSNLPYGEGVSIHRPPVFNGENYVYWKIRMRIFIEAIDIAVWNAIENGPYIPMTKDDDKKEKHWSEWSDDEKKRAQYDYRAKNIITSALSIDEFFRISQCKSAKEMWDTLQVTHEGTSDVKRSRKHTLHPKEKHWASPSIFPTNPQSVSSALPTQLEPSYKEPLILVLHRVLDQC